MDTRCDGAQRTEGEMYFVHTQSLDFPSVEINFCSLSHNVSGVLLWQVKQTHAQVKELFMIKGLYSHMFQVCICEHLRNATLPHSMCSKIASCNVITKNRNPLAISNLLFVSVK